MRTYEIIISWDVENQAYIAEVPELPGCKAFGDTRDSALAKANRAIQLWMDTAKVVEDLLLGKDASYLTP